MWVMVHRRASGSLLTAPLSGHQVVINGYALCPLLSVVRGCDPCRPGAAVQAERPQRSEDERPGRSAVSGTARTRPASSRNVTESLSSGAHSAAVLGVRGIKFSRPATHTE